MKKWENEIRRKRHRAKSARRSLQRRCVRQRRIRHQRRFEAHVATEVKQRRRQRAQLRRKYVEVQAPAIFSFASNTVEMVRFVNSLQTLLEERKSVWVKFEHVTDISNDGLAVLLAVMIRFKESKIDFNGDYPKDSTARDRLVASGFFDNLYRRKDDLIHKQSPNHALVTHAAKRVDAALGADVIRRASKTIWAKPCRCQGAQRVLVELMHNTNNHASLSGGGEKHWWLSTSHDALNKRVSFAFVDFGVGVFKSLREKTSGRWFRAIPKLLERFRYGDDAALLRLIMAGELHRTATGKVHRGKGLPGIAEALTRKQIANLTIVTNTVKGNVSTDTFEVLPHIFNGTFLFWEIDQHCEHCHDHDQDN